MSSLDKIERFLRKKVTRKDAKRFWHVFAWLALGGIVSGVIFFIYLAQGLPSPGEISAHTVSESTKIYDKTGSVVLYEVSGGERRTVVGFNEIPQVLKDATLSIEDKNFYTDPAFNIKGIIRAVVRNITGGDLTGQGGSTITQQLARNAFLSPEKTITRKARELVLAIQIDQQYTKDKILEMYLNEIPYGPTLYGVEAASQAYFKKPVSEINLPEAAILAAIPQAPSRLNPFGTRVNLLMDRQRLVLRRMYELGKISESDYQMALSQPVVFAEQSKYGIKAPHFVLAVQDYLVEKYGEDAVRNGGLKVKTTLDWELQEVAEKIVAEGAASNEKKYGGKNAALVAEDAKTGQILALVGSRDYFDKEVQGSYNVATQALRQPGSTLKPFVYLTGFTKGFTPNTVLFDLPTEFSTNNSCPAVPNFAKTDTNCFHPQNFDLDFRGPTSLRTSLAQSVNVTAVKMLYLAGRKDSVQLMQSFGLSTLNEPEKYGLSLVLGGGAVHLIDLVKAYSVLSQEGILREQSVILEIRDKKNKVLESYDKNETRVIDANPVKHINDILSDPEARRPLFSGSFGLTVFGGHDVALKTGTSNDYKDAWAMGYTPSLVVGVWAGNNNNQAMHKQGSSILAAIPMWSKFMNEALKKQPSETFTQPEPIQTTKPVLAGNYAPEGVVHTILYYVDPEDPGGAPPSNPARNPQFEKWEVAVRNWAIANPIENPNPEEEIDPNIPPTPTSTPPGVGVGTGSGSGDGNIQPNPLFPPIFPNGEDINNPSVVY